MDAFDFLPTLADESVDLILTDPPYAVTQAKWDRPLDLVQLWSELNRIMRPGGTAVVFAQGLFTVDLINANRFNYKYSLIWEKTQASGFLNVNRRPLSAHEDICVFVKPGSSSTYNVLKTQGHRPQTTVQKNYVQSKNQLYGQQTDKVVRSGGETDRHVRSVLRFAKDTQKSALHPTQKPLALVKQLMLMYSHPQDVVLDCFLGSGTTAVAARQLNRAFIGCERDETYCKISKERLKNEV